MTAPKMYRVDPAQHIALRAAAVFAEAVERAAIAAGADAMVHDEITFSGPDAKSKAANFDRTLTHELAVCMFEQWQRQRRAYNRMMAIGLRMVVEGSE